MKRVLFPALALSLVFSAFLWEGPRGGTAVEAFSHGTHEMLFLDCAACHAGAFAEGEPLVSVTPQECAHCHDGEVVDPVQWQPTPLTFANLKFNHFDHASFLECEDCHEVNGAGDFEPFTRETCFDCHDITDHYAAENECATCHEPLAGSDWSVLQAGAFPHPASHDDSTFVAGHGSLLRESGIEQCAVCHTRESCTRCHLNADRVPEIMALASDERGAAAGPGVWPLPDTHLEPGWATNHARMAVEQNQRCQNCHVEESCRECHGSEIDLAAISALPSAGQSGPAGVRLAGKSPPLHDDRFVLNHGPLAGAGGLDCASCHADTFCESCHEPPGSGGYHSFNFLNNHPAAAFGREQDCAGCHSTEVFCRDCHTQSGVGGTAARRGFEDYHNGTVDWFLNHGAAARQNLEACASCHQQNECAQCHSSATGWGVNPHGPGFNAESLRDKAPLMCARCHAGF